MQFKASMKTCCFLILLNYLINQYVNVFFYLAADLQQLNVTGSRTKFLADYSV
jgi:hypothetical protein